MGGKFKIGDRVRVVENGNPSKAVGVIESFMQDVEGGVRLDRNIKGCAAWNVAELEKVTP